MAVNGDWNPNNPTGGQSLGQGQGAWNPFSGAGGFTGDNNAQFQTSQGNWNPQTPSPNQASGIPGVSGGNQNAQAISGNPNFGQTVGNSGSVQANQESAPPSYQMAKGNFAPQVRSGPGGSLEYGNSSNMGANGRPLSYSLATNDPGVWIDPTTGGTWNTPGMGYVDPVKTFGTNPSGGGGGQSQNFYNLPGGKYLADSKTGKVTPIQEQMAQQAQAQQAQQSTPQQSQPQVDQPQIAPETNQQSGGQQNPQLMQILQMLLGGGGGMGRQQNPYQQMNPMAMMLMGQNPFAQMMMNQQNPMTSRMGQPPAQPQIPQQLMQPPQQQAPPQTPANMNPDLNNIYGLDANSRALWGY